MVFVSLFVASFLSYDNHTFESSVMICQWKCNCYLGGVMMGVESELFRHLCTGYLAFLKYIFCFLQILLVMLIDF